MLRTLPSEVQLECQRIMLRIIFQLGGQSEAGLKVKNCLLMRASSRRLFARREPATDGFVDVPSGCPVLSHKLRASRGKGGVLLFQRSCESPVSGAPVRR